VSVDSSAPRLSTAAVVGVAATIALALILAFAAPALAAPKGPSSEEFTPVVGAVPQAPEPYEASDGRTHLVYELVLTNRPVIYPGFKASAATVKQVRVLAGGKTLLSLSGKKLADLTDRFGEPEPGTELAPGQAGFVALDVVLPRGAKVPADLTHRISISLRPNHGVERTTYETGTTAVDKRPAIVLAPPVRGPGWSVGDSCCATLNNHRRGLLPIDGELVASSRYAIAFTQIQPGGNLLSGPPDQFSSYPYYGAPVYAAAAGTVVSTVNDVPEARLGFLRSVPYSEISGNEVVVRMAGNRYASYGQLQTGSVQVRPGQKVKAGQQLARIGSSGYTSGPQLSFKLTAGPEPRASASIPFLFNRFTIAGTLTNFKGLFEGQKADLLPEFLGEHQRQMPLSNQVIDFP
jgi:hypothetical protein